MAPRSTDTSELAHGRVLQRVTDPAGLPHDLLDSIAHGLRDGLNNGLAGGLADALPIARVVLVLAALIRQMLQHRRTARRMGMRRPAADHRVVDAPSQPDPDPDSQACAAPSERTDAAQAPAQDSTPQAGSAEPGVARGRVGWQRVLGIAVRILRTGAGLASLLMWLLEWARQAGLL